MEHRVCRFKGCEHPLKLIWTARDAYVKYGARHYMHGDCYVKSGRPLEALSDFQLGRIPAMALKDAGKLEYAEKRLGFK